MEGFTPAFFLQLFIALASGAVSYGVMRADLANTIRGLDEERRLREELDKKTDESIHDLRGEVGTVKMQVARLEGAKA